MWSLGPVAEDQRINLTFLSFHLQEDKHCGKDYVEVDYSTVHCGHIKQHWSIISRSNIMNVRFSSDGEDNYPGFLAFWSPTTEPPSFKFTFGFGCENCIFPFIYEGRRYHSCTNIDGYKKHWCVNGIIPPTEEGLHVSLAAPTKVPCSDTDSSCYRTPSISTHPNNQAGKCCK